MRGVILFDAPSLKGPSAASARSNKREQEKQPSKSRGSWRAASSNGKGCSKSLPPWVSISKFIRNREDVASLPTRITFIRQSPGKGVGEWLWFTSYKRSRSTQSDPQSRLNELTWKVRDPHTKTQRESFFVTRSRCKSRAGRTRSTDMTEKVKSLHSKAEWLEEM